MSKKCLAVLLAIVMLFACAASAYGFSDTNNHWANTAIEKWSDAGVVKGYSDGTFKPDANITRAEFAVMLNRILKLTGVDGSFTDVETGDWFYNDVMALAKAKVVNGYSDGTFRPNAPITREEASAMFARAFALVAKSTELSFSDKAAISAWALEAVAAMSEGKYINGYPDGSFKPQGLITRAEVVTIINNASSLKAIADYLAAQEKPADKPTTPTTPSGSGSSVRPSRPAAKIEEPSVDNIVEIQPYSALTYYGMGLVKVEITYAKNVDLSDVDEDTYVLQDRGNLTPAFGEIPIESVSVDGQVVTIIIDRDTTANANNNLIYSGEGKTGSRSKDNVSGLNVTTSWYRLYDGTIVDDDHSDLNGGLRGYQFRNLELKLYHAGEDAADALCQADEKGVYQDTDKWLPENIKYITDTKRVDNGNYDYTQGGFMTFEDLGINIPSISGIKGDYVKGIVAFPDNYNPNKQYPLILSFPGGGTALWEITADGKTYQNGGIVIADNAYGCCFFDGSAFNWYENDAEAIVIYMDHRYRSPFVPDVVTYSDLSIPGYNYLKDDKAVIDYFIANYGAKENHIILTGNSQGTVASSNFIKAYPGFISTFICCNGNFGGAFNGGGFTAAELQGIAESGMSTWIFDGEYDTNNIPTFATIQDAYAAAGRSQAEADDNLRITGLDANYNFYWGETDHSATKLVYWYLLTNKFYGNGKIVDQEMVFDTKTAATYSLEGKKLTDGTFLKEGFQYQVYTDQTLMEWALNPDRELGTGSGLTVDDVQSVQAFTGLNWYGQQLQKVEITYKAGVKIPALQPSDFVLLDRGNANPSFARVTITDVQVSGQKVTLTISSDTAATGQRSKNPVGLMCTGSWYIDKDGVLFFGKQDNLIDNNSKANTTGKGYQARENLDLKLYHQGETAFDALCETNGYGEYIADDKWLPQDNGLWDEFVDLEDTVQIASSTGIAGDYVRAKYYLPQEVKDAIANNTDEKFALVVSLTGTGTSYWDLNDGLVADGNTNNYGVNLNFDGSVYQWVQQYLDGGEPVIAMSIHDRQVYGGSMADGTDYKFWVDDKAVLDYFVNELHADPDRIIFTGNSGGTGRTSKINSVYPGLIDVFISNNGFVDRGWLDPVSGGFGATSTDAQRQAAAASGLAIWNLVGQTDGTYATQTQQDFVAMAKYYKEAGYSDEWIADNLRSTVYPSNFYIYWGESDHSSTKMTYWYFFDNIYYGPNAQIVDGEMVYSNKLNVGDTYTMTVNKERNADRTYSSIDYTYQIYGESVMEWALSRTKSYPQATDLAGVPAAKNTPLAANADVNQLPVTGYFKTALTGDYADREIYIYIPETATLRPYYHFIAIDDDVNVDEFLITSGWKNISDETGECLFLLVPGAEGWGDAADEKGYVAAARAYNAKNDYFTTFGLFYFEGYGAGCAGLQAWAAENPQFVIAQAYVGGGESDIELLSDLGAESYGWYTNLTDGWKDFGPDGRQEAVVRMAARLQDTLNPDIEGYEGLLTKADMPVPTWFINSADDAGLLYWYVINDVDFSSAAITSFADQDASGSVWKQNANSLKWATEYAGPISKVVSMTVDGANGYAFNRALRDDLTDYCRYDTTATYANALGWRMDYTDIQVRRYSSAQRQADGEVLATLRDGSVDAGQMYLFNLPLAAGNVTDTYLYIPESAGTENIPVVVVSHGGSQTANLFMDATMWWQVAAENGFAIILSTRTNPANMKGSYPLPEILDQQLAYLSELDGYSFDFGRIYTTGQSMGGAATNELAIYSADQLAAAMGSNFPELSSILKNRSTRSSGEIPTGCIISEGNRSVRGIPGYADKAAADAAGADIIWDTAVDEKSGLAGMANWIDYFMGVNGITYDNLEDKILYFGASPLNGGEHMLGTIANWQGNDARYRAFTWTKDGYPVMQYVYSLYEAHNNLVTFAEIEWGFMKNYRVDLTTGERFYSASGFKNAGDEQKMDLGITAQPLEETAPAKDTPLAENWDGNQLPLTGYFSKQVADGREVRFYIPETAILRPYFHFIAIDNGVDVDEFLLDSGWKQIADETGECLFIMMPGEGGWGELADEVAYIKAAKAFHAANAYFTTFGLFYLEGYGAGAAPLEAWAAENPNLVISQAYIGGESAGTETLTALGSESVGWKHMTDGYIPGKGSPALGGAKIPEQDTIIAGSLAVGAITDGERFDILVQMASRLEDKLNPDHVGFEGLMEKDDFAVPTYLINGSAQSLGYWMAANKTASQAVALSKFGAASVTGSQFDQATVTWSTEYAGTISKVVAMNIASTDGYAFNRELRDQLTDYSRYDSSISYSNGLNLRVDYTALQVQRYTEGQAKGIVDAPTHDGVVPTEISLFSLPVTPDYSTDTLMFVPETAGDSDIPVVLVWHGGSQNGHLFMDASMWWEVAAEEGFAIVLTTRTNPANVNATNSNTAYTNTQMLDAVLGMLKADGRFDLGRIYSTGQSAGGGFTSQLVTEGAAGKLAAAFTSGSSTSSPEGTPYAVLPYALAIGEGNYNHRGIPGYESQEAAAAAGADVMWDPTSLDGVISGMPKWVKYCTEANAPVGAILSDKIQYTGGIEATNGGANIADGTIADWNSTTARFRTFTWNTNEGYPIMQYVFTLYESHNNIPMHAQIMWDFLKCYSVDETGARYYSETGFAADDAVQLIEGTAAQPWPADADLPLNTPTEGNQMELTGYFKANLPAPMENREVRVYIPETAILRPYFHYIAIPDGVDVDQFLTITGWFRVADETGECLYILMPDQATKTWGDDAAEKDYITAARAYHQACGKYFTTFGLFYLTGYAEGAAPLEGWAAENPQLVIAQAYIGGDSYDAAALAALGATSFGWGHPTDGDRLIIDGKRVILDQMTARLKDLEGRTWGDENGLMNKEDMAVPTWLINSDLNDLTYWQGVNQAQATVDATFNKFGGQNVTAKVYGQDADTWTTQYAGQISKVTTMEGVNNDAIYAYSFTNALRDTLTDYSRYDSTICYGNALNWRVDYTALQVERFTNGFATGEVTGTMPDGSQAKATITMDKVILSDGKASDIMVYVPESAVEKYGVGNIPIVYVQHGGSQNGHLFFECTMWWQTAAKEGFALILNTRTCNGIDPATGKTAGTLNNVKCFEAVLEYLENDGSFDLGRVYTTGQSAGCGATNDCAQTMPYDLAAAYGTDGPAPSTAIDGADIPYGLCISEGNYSCRGIPGGYTADVKLEPGFQNFGGLTYDYKSTDAEADGATFTWDPLEDASGNPANFALFLNYFYEKNFLSDADLNDAVIYSGSSSLYGGTDGVGTVADFDTNNARFRVFTWENEQNVPLLQYTASLYQAHNCVPGYRAIIWDFFEHYRIDKDTNIRYYSANGTFEDEVAIELDADDVVDTIATAQSLNEQLLPVNDQVESNQLYFTGYYAAQLPAPMENREVRIYIPETAILRPYFHFIAVPDGVNVDEFLTETDWFNIADATGECLYVLMPDQATNEWGSADAEKDYITAARAYHQACGKYFTTFGLFYLYGYEEGAAGLEGWAAENPQLVISQVYLQGPSYGGVKLDALGQGLFGWNHPTDGDKRVVNGERLILKQMSARLSQVTDRNWGDENGLMYKEDMAIPTWLVNTNNSTQLAYWQKVNKTDIIPEISYNAPEGGAFAVYPQKEDTWSTQYAGQISQVTTVKGIPDIYAPGFTAMLRDELTDYSRYDSTISYGNALNWRVDYTALQYERYTTGSATGDVTCNLLDGSEMTATMEFFLLNCEDNEAPTDAMLFVPQSALDAGDIPVVFVQHGGSQNAALFFDCTMWYQTACAEGFALILTTRTTNGSDALRISNIGGFDAVMTYLETQTDYDFDLSRIYTTGQSAGGSATVDCVMQRTTDLAAGYGTDAGAPTSETPGAPIPYAIAISEGNYTNRGIPGFTCDPTPIIDGVDAKGATVQHWESTGAKAAGINTVWDDPVFSAQFGGFPVFVSYFSAANGVDGIADVSADVIYRGASSLYGGADEIGTIADWNTNNARYRTFNWLNDQDIPVMEYTVSLYQAHNCVPGYRPVIWDYFEHFSVEKQPDGSVIRYYSDDASFTTGHKTAIDFEY